MRVLVIVLAVGVILGHPGLARAQLNCDVGVDFYPGGAIRSCTLSGHHRLHTGGGLVVTCASGHRASLYEDGRLRSCVLARPLTSGPARCAAGDLLELGPDGAPTACGAMPEG